MRNLLKLTLVFVVSILVLKGLSVGGYIKLTSEEPEFDCIIYPGSSVMYVDKQSKDTIIFYVDKIEAVHIKGDSTTIQTDSGTETVIYTPRQCTVVQTPSVVI